MRDIMQMCFVASQFKSSLGAVAGSVAFFTQCQAVQLSAMTFSIEESKQESFFTHLTGMYMWISSLGVGNVVCSSSIFGVSLSEPHTSGTALCTCVCMSVCLSVGLLAAIYRKFQINTLSTLRSPHVPGRWRLQPDCSLSDLKRRRLKFKHAWQLNRDLYSYGQAAHNSVNYGRWLKSLRVKSVHKWHSYMLETQLMIWVWSLVHTNVARVTQKKATCVLPIQHSIEAYLLVELYSRLLNTLSFWPQPHTERATLQLENVEHCGGEPEQADTGTVLY